MSEFPEIETLNYDELRYRVSHGLMQALHAGPGIQEVDCGDFSTLTEPLAILRRDAYYRDVIPARIFGAGSGVGAAALSTIAAQNGEKGAAELFSEWGDDTLAMVSADIAEAALEFLSVNITQHSKVSAELDKEIMTPPQEYNPNPPACKFNLFAGAIALEASSEATLQQAMHIGQLADRKLPLKAARGGLQIVSGLLTPGYTMTRQSLNRARTTHRHMRTTVLENIGNVPNLGVVLDYEGYRSDPAGHLDMSMARYHHTPEVSKLALAWNESLDRELLFASSVLLGVATISKLHTPEQQLFVELIAA
jgi:hypothetical protein